jgi:hypothetical protein
MTKAKIVKQIKQKKNSKIVSGEAFSPQKKNIKHFKHEIS